MLFKVHAELFRKAFLCTEANWGLPTQHFQKGTFVWVSIKNIKKKKNPEMFSIYGGKFLLHNIVSLNYLFKTVQ